MMLISVILIAFSGAHDVIKVAVPLMLCITLLWLWKRPEPRD